MRLCEFLQFSFYIYTYLHWLIIFCDTFYVTCRTMLKRRYGLIHYVNYVLSLSSTAIGLIRCRRYLRRS